MICASAVMGGALYSPAGYGVPTAFAAGSITQAEGKDTTNELDTSYYYYDNQSKIVDSYLYESGENTLTRVEYTESELIAEDIDMSTGKLLKSRTLEMSLPIFGAFYAGKDYNFVVTGQNNPDESNDVKILSVTRYSKDFKSSKTVGLYGRNTSIPFCAGSCKMTEAGGKLYIHTCHQMYVSKDGLNHQANMSYVLDEATMAFEQEHYKVGSSSEAGRISNAFGYASHSFDQFIVTDGEAVYAYDHGDAYPRALRLHKYTLSDGRLSYTNLVNIPGSIGDNYTGVLTGDVELSKDNVLIGVKMADMSSGSLDNYTDLKDIYIIVMPKSGIGGSTSPKLVNLTNYTGKDQSSASSLRQNSAPKMVKINDNKFIVMWQECVGSSKWWIDTVTDKVTKIAVIDGSGKLIGSVMESSEITLSDCDPILCSDGKVRWYAASGGAPVLYAIDPNDPVTFGKKVIKGDADKNGTVDVSDVLLIQQYIAGWNVDIDLNAADVTGDAKANIDDALMIQQHIAGWDVTFK